MKRKGFEEQLPLSTKSGTYQHSQHSSNMYLNGKQTGFSQGFMNIMYRDNSLFAASREKNFKPKKISNESSKHVNTLEHLESRQRKRQIIEIFRARFKIVIKDLAQTKDLDRITEEQLFIKLRQKQLAKVEYQAVMVIQKFARMISKSIWWKTIRAKRWAAASMIQHNYRCYRRWNIIPKMLKAARKEAATIIQKYMKGYNLTKHLFLHIQQHKIDNNCEYFSDLKKKLYVHVVKIISINYLKYKLKKTDEQYVELQKLEVRKQKEKKGQKKNLNYKKQTTSGKGKEKDLTDQQLQNSIATCKKRSIELKMKIQQASIMTRKKTNVLLEMQFDRENEEKSKLEMPGGQINLGGGFCDHSKKKSSDFLTVIVPPNLKSQEKQNIKNLKYKQEQRQAPKSPYTSGSIEGAGNSSKRKFEISGKAVIIGPNATDKKSDKSSTHSIDSHETPIEKRRNIQLIESTSQGFNIKTGVKKSQDSSIIENYEDKQRKENEENMVTQIMDEIKSEGNNDNHTRTNSLKSFNQISDIKDYKDQLGSSALPLGYYRDQVLNKPTSQENTKREEINMDENITNNSKANSSKEQSRNTSKQNSVMSGSKAFSSKNVNFMNVKEDSDDSEIN